MDPNARNPFKNRRLKVLTNPDGSYSTCYVVKGDIVSSELWGDPEDREWALRSGDEDMTYYIDLKQDDEPDPPITNRERRNLQYWQPTGPKVSEILIEVVQPDQHALPPVCMSKDWVYDALYEKYWRDIRTNGTSNVDPQFSDPRNNTVTEETDCDEPAVPGLFQGALVFDVQHGYKEIHPGRGQRGALLYDSENERYIYDGNRQCSAWREDENDCRGHWPPVEFPGLPYS